LISLSLVEAAANSRAASAAAAVNLAGGMMVALAGQVIRTVGGWSAGWISLVVIVSAPLIGPQASVIGDEGKAGSVPV
jgi:hypothetical protein